MKQISIISLLFLFLNLSYGQHSNLNDVVIEMDDKWSEFFKENSIDGTFILMKLNSDTLNISNNTRASKQYLPASTFKILNSLISLETKAVKNENEIIKWDGKKRFYDKWNQDQNLKSAIKYSCVWFYQELARRVGVNRMQHYLDTVKYGNSKIGADIDKFWLEGDLRISAYEQILFLNNFLKNNLPFSANNMRIVKNILLVDSTESYKLYAKTGWTARVNKDEQIGWYVGFVENNEGVWIFAMNIDIKNNSDTKFREEITRKILKKEGLIN